MVEMYLFLLVGAVAVAAAAMMLWSENAVHSALFLILNFACVAFMYLLLEAPFLAMVQIAVYAGAIMVLFLFVIMLLGAEQAESPLNEMRSMRGYRFHTPIAMLLALVLLFTVGIAIGRGDISALQSSGTPMLRVAHLSGAANVVDVELNGELFAEDLAFRSATAFMPLPAGEYDLRVLAAGASDAQDEPSGEAVVLETTITLQNTDSPETATTIALYGVDEAQFAQFNEDVSAPPERQSRLVVLNGMAQAISLQDTGIFGRDGDGSVLVSNLEPGEVSDPVLLDENIYDSLRFVRPLDEEDDSEAVNPLFTVQEQELDREQTTLVVLKDIPGSEVPDVGIFATDTFAAFGSPKAVGQLLFTRYLLPFEVVSLLLLAALVGVIVIAQRQVSPAAARQSAARHRVRRRVSRPLANVIASQVNDDSTPQLGSGD